MRRNVIVFTLIWLACLQALSAETVSLEVLEESPRPPSAPAEPAELSWTDLSGRPLDLEALHGRVVVVNFWATWCAPCLKEMPHLTRLQRRYGLHGVQVIGAAADAPDQRAAVDEFARRLKIEFPVVLGATTDQMRTLGLGVSLPATVVLDREGHAVERFDGVFQPAMLEQAVERALDLELGEVVEPTGHVRAAAAAPAQASLVPS